jgi:glycosyltransferase involved in cell wall biosynthesis
VRWLTIFGFLTPMKGYETALRAIRELPPEVGLVIAGGPRTPDMEPYRHQLLHRIEKDGLRDRVRITGYLDDAEVANVMAASEVVLVPHLQATGSYSVMIALAHGRPVVASDLDIFREIHSECGGLRLVRTGDADHLAACLKAVLNNPQGRMEMSERALGYAKAHSWQEASRRTVEVYAQALADERRLGGKD